MSGSGGAAGRKDDEGKLRWDLVPWRELEDVVSVLTYGADKYEDNGGQQVSDPVSRYFSAAMRHVSAYRQGEHLDPDSGLPHLAHAICSLMFVAWHERGGETYE